MPVLAFSLPALATALCCARRPDRARVVTENPAEPLTSTRLRTRTAPGHLVLVLTPSTPAGVAFTPYRTANAVTPHDTLSAAHYVPRTIIYQTTARPVSSAILYETPPLAHSDTIYSTSRDKIIYHARSAAPTFAPHPDSAYNTFTLAQAEAQQRANQQYYLAQHRPNALAQLLGRAPGARRPFAHLPHPIPTPTPIHRRHLTRQPSMSTSRCLGRRVDVPRWPGRVHDTEERARRG
ncbi:hypothetical protein B0H17DRAFT_1049124 [Mycena rosella]|uniref:Uncharacterized protein n=1 Tax=Mycena rosella TaxID=1033263 RepID=A0AAD7DV30_MYCRO|nr:hypothetical protein B0H17DRAFT_1049124 [Mycena rosella]